MAAPPVKCFSHCRAPGPLGPWPLAGPLYEQQAALPCPACPFSAVRRVCCCGRRQPPAPAPAGGASHCVRVCCEGAARRAAPLRRPAAAARWRARLHARARGQPRPRCAQPQCRLSVHWCVDCCALTGSVVHGCSFVCCEGCCGSVFCVPWRGVGGCRGGRIAPESFCAQVGLQALCRGASTGRRRIAHRRLPGHNTEGSAGLAWGAQAGRPAGWLANCCALHQRSWSGRPAYDRQQPPLACSCATQPHPAASQLSAEPHCCAWQDCFRNCPLVLGQLG